VIIEALFALAVAAPPAAPAADALVGAPEHAPEDAGESLPLTRTLEASFPSDGVTHLALQQVTADIDLIAGDGDEIAVTLELESERILVFSNRRTTWAIHRANINATEVDGTLTLDIEFPVRVDPDWLNTRWTVEVPRALAAEVRITNGAVGVSGLEGGVLVRTTNGTIDVDVPQGPLDLASVNGAVLARVAETEFAALTLSVVNGTAGLTIDGEQQDLGLFESAERQGTGQHDLRLETVNGSVSLYLGQDPD
jgi:hypothetical protein